MKKILSILLVSLFLIGCRNDNSNYKSKNEIPTKNTVLDQLFLGFKFGDSRNDVEDRILLLLNERKIKYQEDPSKLWTGMKYTYEFIPNKEDYYVVNGNLSKPIIGVSTITFHYYKEKLYWIYLSVIPSNYFVKEKVLKELYSNIVSLYKDKYGFTNQYTKENWYWSNLYKPQKEEWSDHNHKNIWEFKDDKYITIENSVMSKYPYYLWDESHQWIEIEYFDNKIKEKIDSEIEENIKESQKLEKEKRNKEKTNYRKNRLNDL